MADDLERLLADLDSEEETDSTDEVSKNRPNAVKQLRDHAKRLERDLSKEKKAREELEAFKTSYEAKEKASTLKDAGLSEKQAAAFLRMYDEVTPESVSSFKTDILGVTGEQGESPAPSGFAPTQGYAEPGKKTYSKQDFEAIMRENPSEGWKLLNSGQVKF